VKVLVSGTKSGLGRFIHERIGGAGVTRDTVIVHCAHQPLHHAIVDFAFSRNVELTTRLAALPHKKFIFISSVDVYRGTPNGKCKRVCEHIVHKLPNYLILRVSLILGKFQRPNTVTKIRNGLIEETTLSGDSKFFYIYNKEILEFIKQGIKEDLQGTHRIGTNDSVKLEDLAKFYNSPVKFGDYIYKVEESLI